MFEIGKKGPEHRFISIINQLINKIVKIPCTEDAKSEVAEIPKSSRQLGNFAALIIERAMKVLTTVSLFLEDQKKRDK